MLVYKIDYIERQGERIPDLNDYGLCTFPLRKLETTGRSDPWLITCEINSAYSREVGFWDRWFDGLPVRRPLLERTAGFSPEPNTAPVERMLVSFSEHLRSAH
jgi:hypothetical protein